jgi:metal-responsive CopG/Arc/MetJ family transcriptional regulator
MPVSVKLATALVQQLDDISDRENRTRSGTMRSALLTFVKEYQQKDSRRKSA